MPDATSHHSLPLARNQGWWAHIRRSDLSVLFTTTPVLEPAELFSTHGDILAREQGAGGSASGRRTFSLYLVLTDRCNLRCTYCDVLGPPSQREHGVIMAPETARLAVDTLLLRLREQPDLQAQVVFFGGEPLMAWPLLARICGWLDESPEAARIARMLVTNGTLLDEARVDLLGRHKVYVVVSLDGTAGVNDLVRLGADGLGSYHAVARGLDLLGERLKGRYGISCTLGSHNDLEIAAEITHLQERFQPCCVGVNIPHLQRDGSLPIALSPERTRDAMLRVFDVARERGVAIYQFIGILKAFRERRRNLDYCPACVDKLLFSPQGRVGRCETLMADPRYTVPLHALRGAELPDHLDWRAFTPEHEPECIGCVARWICPGSCAYDQIVRTGAPAGVDPRRCLVHKALLVELLELLFEQASVRPHPGPVVPSTRDFQRVAERVPLEFLPDTIWIVSHSGVTGQA